MNRNIPDVHANDRVIPEGKVLITGFMQSPPEDDPRAIPQTLDVKAGWGRREVRLVAIPAGWAVAGAAMRWDNGCYAVQWEIDGSTHGRRFRDFDSALDAFNKIPEKDPYEEYKTASK